MADLQSVRVFGPPAGAAGLAVIERSGNQIVIDSRYGTTAFFGVQKRGPMGVAIPYLSKEQYLQIAGDPKDSSWHLYPDASHLCPDAIDGFFNGAGSGAMTWITRVELENARPAKIVVKNRLGTEILELEAANQGRWGGYRKIVPFSTVVVATAKTFTIVAPGIFANELVDANIEFSGSNKTYQVIANTASNPISGEVVFTIGSQYDLFADGVSGPLTLSGLATYSRHKNLVGTIEFQRLISMMGTVTISGTTVIGVGTRFSSDLKVGDPVYYAGESRRVTSITSNTSLTIESPFIVDGVTATILEKDNLEVVGNNTTFLVEVAPGDKLYCLVNGIEVVRTVASVVSNTSLLLESGFESDVNVGTVAYLDNYWVDVVDGDLLSELLSGEKIIDPNRRGDGAIVMEIQADRFKVAKPFYGSFVDAELAKQSQVAKISLIPPEKTGLSVEIGQGTAYPETHFSLQIRFNNSLVVSIADASLDPSDSLFVETLVNNTNVAYRTGTENYLSWVRAKSFWNGSTASYTTAMSNDVRPTNGSGTILSLTQQRIYTIGDFDYQASVGNYIYPNPYRYARNAIRVKQAKSPVVLAGTVSTMGSVVTGSGTAFRSVVAAGDLVVSPAGEIRTVRQVIGDTELSLTQGFSVNLTAGSKLTKSGYLSFDSGVDLTRYASQGDRFIVSFPQYFEGGYDGDSSMMQPYHFTRYLDPDLNFLEQAVYGLNVGLVRFAIPGVNDLSVQKAGIAYAESVAFEFRAEIPAFINNVAVAESYVNLDLGRSDHLSVAFPSYAFIPNPRSRGDRMICISGDIMGLESAMASRYRGYHYVAAGLNAVLGRISKLPFTPNPREEGILNLAGIQPIKYFGGQIIIFGSRCPAQNSIYTFLHVRRTQSNYVRIFLEAQPLLQQLFRPNQPEMSDRLLLALEGFAKEEYQKGVYSRYLTFDQAVRFATVPSVGEQGVDVFLQVANGKLKLFYSWFPTGILERLELEIGPESLVSRFGSSVTT
jgi:hypothetical protein